MTDENGNGHEDIEGTAEERGATTAALERRPGERNGGAPTALMPLNADAVIAGEQAYQALLPRLLVAPEKPGSDYQFGGRERDRNAKYFVKKSGWRKIARAFHLSVEVTQLQVERNDEGSAVRATAIARANAPNGQFQDGDGHCSIEEKRFQSMLRDRNQRDNLKLENDLRATATTRAKNRAISDLVGMGEVSAEEVEGGRDGEGGVVIANKALTEQASKAVVHLAGSTEAAEALWNEITGELESDGDAMTRDAATALVVIARTLGGKQATTAKPTGKPPKATAAVITVAQKRKFWGELEAAGIKEEEGLRRAIVQWIAGVEHLDRVPRVRVDDLFAAIRDHEATLSAITDAAAEGDEQAQAIVERHLS